LQFRYWQQNYTIYGNFLGQNLSGQANTYVNERFDLAAITSNIVRNIATQYPIPIFTDQINRSLEVLHNRLEIDINDFSTTYNYHNFHLNKVIYPQEDIASNPIHISFFILLAVFLYKKHTSSKNVEILYIYLFSLISFIVFSILLKWEPYHPRLLIPILVVSSILASVVMVDSKYNKLLKIFTATSMVLGILMVIFNINKPYVSYNAFYRYISSYAPVGFVPPEAFYNKPRLEQYFNSRPYLYEPYQKFVDQITTSHVNTLALNLHEEYEYPIWVLFKSNVYVPDVVPYDNSDKFDAVLSTAVRQLYLKGYRTECVYAREEFGYVCLSQRI
jgi:hypothetical protein